MLQVNSAARALGRTEVGISAPPEHVSCTPCRQFASIGGLFSAVRVVLDGPVAARDAVIEATLRDRGWTSLRGRGRRAARLPAALAWAERTQAPDRTAGPPDRARLRRDFEAVWDQIIDSFLARYNSSSPAERPGIVEQSPFEECDVGDAALLGIRGPDGAAAYFRPRATAVRARRKVLPPRGIPGRSEARCLVLPSKKLIPAR